MNDTDVIARVYPVLEGAGYHALDTIRKHPKHIAPQPPKAQPRRHRQDRGSTEPPDNGTLTAYSDLPYLELRFSDIPHTKHGVVFGSDPKSDVVLPDTIKGISFHHFSLTFDDERRFIVKDWGSLVGTQVRYNDQGHGMRRNFQWIIGGHRMVSGRKIFVSVDNRVQFCIIVSPLHDDIQTQSYKQKVDRFRRGSANTADLFRDLNLPPRPDTELPTGAHTPGKGAIYLSKKLGEGGFGFVAHMWNVSDGTEFALKEPSQRAVGKRGINHEMWRKEIRIMSQINHPHIVQLLQATLTPQPRLFLEFMHGGSLEDHDRLTPNETRDVLSQCLSALTYLHEQQPPIVHRDIKPGNILVKHRYPGNIHVKFGDFGLARDGFELLTICGSQPYQAPEIYMGSLYLDYNGTQPVVYNAAVDIWSLGVTISELMYDLPPWREEYVKGGVTWCQEIRSRLEYLVQWTDLLQLLLDSMVVMEPQSRWQARDCLSWANLLPRPSEASASSPPRSQGIGGNQKTIMPSKNPTTTAQQTALLRPQQPSTGRPAGPSRSPQPQPAPATRPGTNKQPPAPSVSTSPPQAQASQQSRKDAVPGKDTMDAAMLLQAIGQQNPREKSPIRRSRSPARQAAPRSPRAASHASIPAARDLMHDRPGVVYLVFQRQPVSLHKQDLQLNASQILTAAGVKGTQRENLLKSLKQRGAVSQTSKKDDVWVPFRDGVFLLQHLGLEDALRPLLNHAQLALPRREDNYLLTRQHRARTTIENPSGALKVPTASEHDRNSGRGSHGGAHRPVSPSGNAAYGVSNDPRRPSKGPETGQIPRSFAQGGDSKRGNGASYFTEPSYQNGLYPAPINQSHLQPVEAKISSRPSGSNQRDQAGSRPGLVYGSSELGVSKERGGWRSLFKGSSG